MAPRRRRRRQSTTRGTVMVLFALVVVVILGTIGLVIEVGTVRVTRERMQSAADSVALEVLRERDLVVDVDHDAFDRDRARRERNRRFASWTFANEISDSYTGDEQGAGPYIDLESTAADPEPVDRTLMLREVGHGVPVLETNYDGSGVVLNERNGDIVSGAFNPHEGGVNGNPIYREAADYTRLDFDPAEPAEAPAADSVLVRLRRTVPHISGGGPWNDVQEDVSSSGWTLPLVFGLGSTFMAGDPGAEYSIRHHGLPLRATAIAEARPAVRVGEARPDLGEEWAVGAGPLAFWWDEWVHNDGFEEHPETGLFYADLKLSPPIYKLTSVTHDSFVVGWLSPKEASQVGDPVYPDQLEPNIVDDEDQNLKRDFWDVGECFVPLYVRGLAAGQPDHDYHVCGYARVRVDFLEETPPVDHNPDDVFMRITKMTNGLSPGEPWLAARNASAVFDGTQVAEVFPHSSPTWDSLIGPLFTTEAPLTLKYVFESRVYAPAHAR